MRAAVAVTLLAVLAVANAQYIPWANPFEGKPLTRADAQLVVPQCSGSIYTNCWEQTKGAPDVTINRYAVTSSSFPCTSGQSATALDFDLKVALNDGKCTVACSGFGCSNREITVCSDAFNFPQCPQPAGAISVVGKSGECSSGFGDYTVTITCPQFEFVTYITY